MSSSGQVTDISRHHNGIENQGLSIIRELERQSLRQHIDSGECDALAKDLGRLLQRWRRSTNLSIETIRELSKELAREERLIEDMKKRVANAEDKLSSASRECIAVNAAILQLEQTLDLS
jgi:chromosome segregation ATPase